MKIERTKNATRNMIFGWMLQIYQLIMPFIMRTAMIYFMGVQYLGLSSLFTSILSVLNLAELGVGSAMVYSMYKPIAEDDTDKICKLMRQYRTYYRIIGFVVAILGLLILPFIPQLIKEGVPDDVSIYILYLLNLSSTVLTYWLFAYKNCLISAHQRVDITSKISIVIFTIRYALQLFVLYAFRNYYAYLIVMIVTQIATNIVTAWVASKMFPDYRPVGKLAKNEVKEINHRIRDLFTSKLGAVIVNQVDTIVISAFLGLKMLAIYQNYFFILTSIKGVMTIALNACTAGIGNSIVVESSDKNLNDLKKLTLILGWFSGFCTCCLLCLYQPFMELWVGNELMLGFSAVICFGIYFFVMEINQLLNLYKDAGGLWHEDRFRPIVVAVSNLAMNLIMVQFWGIYGIIISTVLSALIIGMPWLLHNLFTVLFSKEDFKSYLSLLLRSVVATVIAAIACLACCHWIRYENQWVTMLLRGVICCIIPNLIFLVAYHKQKEFAESVKLLDNITKGKFKLSKFIKKQGGLYDKSQ